MKSLEQIDANIDAINKRHKTAGIKVTMKRIGRCIYLIFTADPIPGSGGTKRHQHKLPTYGADPKGVKLAERKAKEIGGALSSRTFDWINYKEFLKPEIFTEESESFAEAKTELITVNKATELLEKKYFLTKERNATDNNSWKKNYVTSLNKVTKEHGEESLTVELLRSIIELQPKNSSTRKRTSEVFKLLAACADIEADFSDLAGSYSSSNSAPRNPPSDDLIADWFFKIEDPAWRWGYGMIATYGLRPHELFHLELEHFIQTGQMLEITGGKTGVHQVWPFRPEWVELFKLREVNLPEVRSCEINSDYGQICWEHLRCKSNLPFNLYDLRHAWAIRTMKFSLPDALAARQMGHSLAVHTKTYLKWINKRDQQEEYDRLMQKYVQDQTKADPSTIRSETAQSDSPPKDTDS
ncbi:hypothetical protein H6G00_15660 [Leptolyngbya sp. FACHB-541]|uniref:hypothetical protein n=1 Tax=Leptolyngbya sp. FACHB-541 TaxID=2692810 RepID=UPI001688C46B|nr:hypothetical protein [Leptolyngbya sp. FACHB-541]MBD1998048.1 hypothetical protein [Leptolyngbya sp. FACHB-541]